ncbi:MAG: MiaB/RimO family radical SAM methylthiotransferase [Actinomycetota bacterium]|nr:MiaB/RimO family radical SAM methylthiotransferase [Actinomycetota bacterium]
MAKKFFVRTFGCQMNEHDSERIAAELGADGMERTEVLEDADVVVLNTCCIRENADNKLYGNLGHLKALRDRRPDLQIAVGGCLAQKDRSLILERAPHVDAVFGTHNVGRAAALLREARARGESVVEILDGPSGDEAAFPSAMAVRPELSHAAWVTIQVGCDNSCAFCIVPSVRGPEQSRPFGDLLGEVEALAASGTVEVTLLGQNVNSYGRDLTLSLRDRPEADAVHLAGPAWAGEVDRRTRPLFGDLLRAVGSVRGIQRVRFTSPHPKDLRPETIAAMAETEAVCEQLHLPLQSGSDRVLAAMRRGYRAERYLERLAAARSAIPDLAVTTDLIVGFPGETEADFEATLEVVAEARYDSAYTFIFSPRPGTRAAELTEQFVPAEVVAERFERLKVVVERSALAAHQARVGRLEEVLVEGPSKKDAGVLAGRTRQGKLVHFGADEPVVEGDFAQVRITRAAPHHLSGTLESLEHRARGARRASIPLSVG